MSDLVPSGLRGLTTPEVGLSLAFAAALTLSARATRRWFATPAVVVWASAPAAVLAITGYGFETYLGQPIRPFDARSVAPAAVGLAALMLPLAGGARGGLTASRAATLAPMIAVSAIGVMLCVPETGGLRLLVGPLVLAAAASARRWTGLWSPWEVIAAGTMLTWIAAVDGRTRWSAIIGAAACVGAVGLIPLAAGWAGPPGRVGRSSRTDRSGSSHHSILAIHLIVVLICSRIAGVARSTTFSIGMAATAVLAAMVAAWVLGRPDRQRIHASTPSRHGRSDGPLG